MKWPLKMHCAWSNWTQAFWDADEFRRGVQTSIAAARVQIHLPVETWAEVLPSCGQKSLEEGVCLTRRLFHAIARPLLDGPKGRILSKMAFVRSREGNDVVLVKRVESSDGKNRLVELPIAEVPSPKTVVGFSSIRIIYFDSKVLSFLCAIRPLLRDLWLELSVYTIHRNWLKADPKRHYDWPIYGSDQHNLGTLECLLRVFREGAITTLCIGTDDHLISAQLLARLLTNVRHLRLHSAPPAPGSMSLLVSGDPHNSSPYISVLVKWLHTPAEDGKQKMASFNIKFPDNLADLIRLAKEHFLSSDSAPIPYFVGLYSSAFEDAQSVELPFSTLHNECTGEVLSLRYYSEPLVFNDIWHNFVLWRRSRASTEEGEEAELLAIQEIFSRALFSNEAKRNKLELKVAEISAIDESLFPTDSCWVVNPNIQLTLALCLFPIYYGSF